MAIPGVTPTDQLLSLTDQSDDGSIGAVLGYGSAAEKNYRQSLAGQRAPIFGKGGVQFASFAPYNTIFSLTDDDQTAPDQTVPITAPNDRPVSDDTADSGIVDNLTSAIPSVTGPTGTFTPAPNQTQYGALTSFVQDKIGDANIDVPGIGNVNVPNTAVNTLVDSALPIVPGLGLVSSLINPTMVETSWGTPFNTGGGGLMGIAGQISLNNLENIYSETQAGTEGYDFYAPGSLPGVNTPIGVSPGLFGFGTVVSGNTNMLPSQADTNKDGEISTSEVLAYTDPDSQGRKDFQTFTDNKTAAQEARTEYEKQLEESGGAGFVGGSVVTDSEGNPVTSIDQKTGEKVAVTSGGTYVNYGALPSEEETSTTTESTGNIFSAVGDFFSGVFGSDPEPEPEVSTSTGDITSQGIMDAITGGMENASSNQRPEGTFEVASSNITTNDSTAMTTAREDGFFSDFSRSLSDDNYDPPGNVVSRALGITKTSDSDNDGQDDSGGGGDGCVIATHGVMTGGFTLMEKAKAELWCQKTYHGKWYGEAFRRGYRAAGQRCIDQGKAREHYQEFKDFVAYGRGVKKGLVLGIKYYMRTIQFFVTGLFIKEN